MDDKLTYIPNDNKAKLLIGCNVWTLLIENKPIKTK